VDGITHLHAQGLLLHADEKLCLRVISHPLGIADRLSASRQGTRTSGLSGHVNCLCIPKTSILTTPIHYIHTHPQYLHMVQHGHAFISIQMIICIYMKTILRSFISSLVIGYSLRSKFNPRHPIKIKIKETII
jgi:hypothetical protein